MSWAQNYKPWKFKVILEISKSETAAKTCQTFGKIFVRQWNLFSWLCVEPRAGGGTLDNSASSADSWLEQSGNSKAGILSNFLIILSANQLLPAREHLLTSVAAWSRLRGVTGHNILRQMKLKLRWTSSWNSSGYLSVSLLLAILSTLVILQNPEWVSEWVSQLVTFVFQGLAERSSASQKLSVCTSVNIAN